MTFHDFQSAVAFSAFVARLILSHFQSPFNIFFHCFPLMRFLLPFHLSQDVPVSFFSSNGQKECLAYMCSIYELSFVSFL